MTVLITGVGQGIGKALAQKFLAEDWMVIGTVLTSSPDYSNPKLTIVTLDLSDPTSITKAAEEIKKTGAQIDLLINNAGALFDDEETKVVVNKLRQTLEVNLIGTVDFTENLLPLIKTGGHIINISSSAGSLKRAAVDDEDTSHYPGHYPSYKISKAGLNMYTRTLAHRLNEQITVSSVHPGWVKTAMGGEEADLTPEEVAEDIYKFALSQPETGQFWFKGEKYPW